MRERVGHIGSTWPRDNTDEEMRISFKRGLVYTSKYFCFAWILSTQYDPSVINIYILGKIVGLSGPKADWP